MNISKGLELVLGMIALRLELTVCDAIKEDPIVIKRGYFYSCEYNGTCLKEGNKSSNSKLDKPMRVQMVKSLQM